MFFSAVLGLFASAQQQPPGGNEVVQQVFEALTADAPQVAKDVDKHLLNIEWEALAYWDKNDPKQLEYMHEAVGDVYQFQNKSFAIKAIDPENPRQYLPTLTGQFSRSGNVITLSSAQGSQLQMTITFLDENYLIVEMEGLRIFMTKSRSYNAQ